jgi:hypothetical protein
MFLQSAELRLIGSEVRAELELSCGLSNIARGSCMLRVSPVDLARHGCIGRIDVQVDRPIMRGEIHLSRDSFQTVLENLRREPPRPTAIVVMVAETLDINLHGDLRIDAERSLTVTDISFNVPLQ